MPPSPPQIRPVRCRCGRSALAEGNELARYALGYRCSSSTGPARPTAAQALFGPRAAQRPGPGATSVRPASGSRTGKARSTLRQALEATASGSFDTDAPELLPRSSTASRPGAHGSGIHPLLRRARPARGRLTDAIGRPMVQGAVGCAGCNSVWSPTDAEISGAELHQVYGFRGSRCLPGCRSSLPVARPADGRSAPPGWSAAPD